MSSNKRNIIEFNEKNKRFINIIIRNENGQNVFVERKEFNKKTDKSIYDILRYVQNKFKTETQFCGNFDDNTREEIIYNLAKNNNDFIDWNFDFYKLDLEDAYNYYNKNYLTIVVLGFECGIGSSSGSSLMEAVEIILFIIKIIKKTHSFIRINKNPFTELEKKYHIDEKFIKGVITKGEKWKVGFISKEEISNKKTVENSIMKKLGYKKQKGIWIATKNYYKYPNELYY